MGGYRNILLVTDFSDAAEHALHTAVDMAQRHSAEMHLLHIVVSQMYYPEMQEIIPIPLTDVTEQLKQSAEQRLQAMADKLGDDIQVHYHVREVPTRAADGITDLAQELAAGLIVIGSHGHGGLVHALLGSTVERVVREATCDVLVVKRKST